MEDRGYRSAILCFQSLWVDSRSLRRKAPDSSVRVRHSRMLVAGIQANSGLDPRYKHSGVTTLGNVILRLIDAPQLPAGMFNFPVYRGGRFNQWYGGLFLWLRWWWRCASFC